MSQDVIYTRTWGPLRRRVGEVYSVEHAQSLHAAGQPYTAVLRADAVPFAAVAVNQGHGTVIVHLLNAFRRPRERHTYAIDQQNLGCMALDEITYYGLGDPDRPSKHHFNRRDRRSWELTVSSSSGDLRRLPGRAPASWDQGNELPVPAFGDYAYLVRRDLFDPHDFVLDG